MKNWAPAELFDRRVTTVKLLGSLLPINVSNWHGKKMFLASIGCSRIWVSKQP